MIYKESLFHVRVAKWLHFKLTVFLSRVTENTKMKEQVEWQNLFADGKFFDFEVEEGLLIRLYKDSVLSKLIYKGFERSEITFTKKVLRENDIVLDIGANIGLFSIIASKIVGERGKVIAYEPSPITYKRLVENIEMNKLQNIVTRPVGLSEKQGKLKFNVSNNGFDAWNTFAQNDTDGRFQESILVNVETLDAELDLIDKADIAFVKIDVEGWEKFVLLGGRDFFNKYEPIVMVEFTEENTFQAGYFVQEIYDCLKNWGYTWYRLSENGDITPETRSLHYPYCNLVATKNYEFLKARIS